MNRCDSVEDFYMMKWQLLPDDDNMRVAPALQAQLPTAAALLPAANQWRDCLRLHIFQVN
jgi:hypothetical protein